MIRVLFFAGMQEKIGKSEMILQADNITVKDLKNNHLARFNMDVMLEEAMTAVNEEYASDQTVLHTGDVVAFIPPVSGG